MMVENVLNKKKQEEKWQNRTGLTLIWLSFLFLLKTILNKHGKLLLFMFIIYFIYFLSSSKLFFSSRDSFKNVAFVEKVGKNYLFRTSNVIFKNGVFAFDELKIALKKEAKNNNITLPNEFYLIDFSLLFLEFKDIKSEVLFFKKNPHLGEYRFNKVFALFEDYDKIAKYKPFSLPILFIFDKFVDYFEETLLKLRMEVEKQDNIPKIIIVHCHSGKDRTGILMAGYEMLYMNKAYKDVIKQRQKKSISEPRETNAFLFKRFLVKTNQTR